MDYLQILEHSNYSRQFRHEGTKCPASKCYKIKIETSQTVCGTDPEMAGGMEGVVDGIKVNRAHADHVLLCVATIDERPRNWRLTQGLTHPDRRRQ